MNIIKSIMIFFFFFLLQPSRVDDKYHTAHLVWRSRWNHPRAFCSRRAEVHRWRRCSSEQEDGLLAPPLERKLFRVTMVILLALKEASMNNHSGLQESAERAKNKVGEGSASLNVGSKMEDQTTQLMELKNQLPRAWKENRRTA